MSKPHEVSFANESADYRVARDALLAAERDLRRQVEAVAAQRRTLPPGGEVPQDYVFEEAVTGPNGESVRSVRLSELFGRHGSLIAYSFMYGPDSPPCPMCTAMLDSLDGSAEHVGQRAALVVIAKSPIGRIREHARARSWRRLRLLSSAANSYNRDYRGESAEGAQMPALNVFVRHDGRIRHYWHSELLYAGGEPGQDPRHVDPIWPLWNLLDLTPEGRGTDWYPRLDYA
jgi:predicted dithiol-disulfide oxidoreductase (DUF899 family)